MDTIKSRLILPPEGWLQEAAVADFERLDAATYIAEIRQPLEADLPVDWYETLAGLNASLQYAPLASSGMLMGNKYTPQVWVDSRGPKCRQNITIGHELGHHFLLHVVQMPSASRNDGRKFERQEAFCDYFAHRLIGRPACLGLGLERP